MARQLNQHFIGRIGNLIYYELNGGYYIRSVPAQVKQHPASKPASSNLTIASRAGKRLRLLLAPVLPVKMTKTLQNRFSGSIMRWLNQPQLHPLPAGAELPCLQNFLFNEATSIKERLKIDMQLTRSGSKLLQLHLPAFIPTERISAPAYTKLVDCTITAAACMLQTDEAMTSCTFKTAIPYNAVPIPAQTINLPVEMAAGGWVVVAIALTYITGKKGAEAPCTNPAFMPSEIIAAMQV
jgi:hypothetical protein